MRKRELEKKMKALGWWLKRHGASHDVWTNGEESEPIPRHAEIVELLAKKILKKARLMPPQKGGK